MLRRWGDVKLDAKLQAGAAGKILGRSETKHKLRKDSVKDKKGKGALAGVTIEVGSGKGIQEQIRDALTHNAVRVIDLFQVCSRAAKYQHNQNTRALTTPPTSPITAWPNPNSNPNPNPNPNHLPELGRGRRRHRLQKGVPQGAPNAGHPSCQGGGGRALR